MQVMGVVNVTPDSFSDGGRFLDHAAALAHARRLVGEGADWIDVGGESTRPGAAPVPAGAELARVLPVVEALAAEGVPVSVDTRKAEVATAAVAAGARMVNDVSAGLAEVAGGAGSPSWPCTCRVSRPRCRTPPSPTTSSPRCATTSSPGPTPPGPPAPEVWIDPGIGFGKTLDHNLALLADLDVLVATGYPVLVAAAARGCWAPSLPGPTAPASRRRPATGWRARSPPPGRSSRVPAWSGRTTWP